ncbi:unnamed protein product [Phaeothamnion confervicola]
MSTFGCTSRPVDRRADVAAGAAVNIVEKQNQRTGLLTSGIVARLLTKSAIHPRGIKVMLEDGRVGRVQRVSSVGCIPVH